jgi:hypothetical protein
MTKKDEIGYVIPKAEENVGEGNQSRDRKKEDGR